MATYRDKVINGKMLSVANENIVREENDCRETEKKRLCRAPTSSVTKNGDTQLEKMVPVVEENSHDAVVTTLPLKFSFEDSDTESSEKSEFDEEIEKLFEEMNYVLSLLNAESSDAATVSQYP